MTKVQYCKQDFYRVAHIQFNVFEKLIYLISIFFCCTSFVHQLQWHIPQNFLALLPKTKIKGHILQLLMSIKSKFTFTLPLLYLYLAPASTKYCMTQ